MFAVVGTPGVKPPVNCAKPKTSALVKIIRQNEEDFEWYPTTQAMIDVVATNLPDYVGSVLDIGAGDGRVLSALADAIERQPEDRFSNRGRHRPNLYAIEKATHLVHHQPDEVVPVGTEFYEQNLACLPADVLFCNPPYSQFEAWACRVIEGGYAQSAYLILPRRWADSAGIAASIKRRGVEATVIGEDDFHDAERRARAVVDIIKIDYPLRNGHRHGYHGRESIKNYEDPFDVWFERNINTFDRPADIDEPKAGTELAKLPSDASIEELVEAYNVEYAVMEKNYRAIFALDYALLKELGVDKSEVRAGIKKRMSGLKGCYWQALFDRLEELTRRLTTRTRSSFLDQLNGRNGIEFTVGNARAVVIWAIKNANHYISQQVVDLFLDLATCDGVEKYVSNTQAWSEGRWRFKDEGHNSVDPQRTHYQLDYRIVKPGYAAIFKNEQGFGIGSCDYPGDLHKSKHDLIADIVAVMGNFGYRVAGLASTERAWIGGHWQDFALSDGRVLFQVKAYKNGNAHLRFMPEAIKQLNVEAGRLLGWLGSPVEAVRETGCTVEQAEAWFASTAQIGAGQARRMLGESAAESV